MEGLENIKNSKGNNAEDIESLKERLDRSDERLAELTAILAPEVIIENEEKLNARLRREYMDAWKAASGIVKVNAFVRDMRIDFADIVDAEGEFNRTAANAARDMLALADDRRISFSDNDDVTVSLYGGHATVTEVSMAAAYDVVLVDAQMNDGEDFSVNLTELSYSDAMSVIEGMLEVLNNSEKENG